MFGYKIVKIEKKSKLRVLQIPTEHIENVIKHWDRFVDAKNEKHLKRYKLWSFISKVLPEVGAEDGAMWQINTERSCFTIDEIL